MKTLTIKDLNRTQELAHADMAAVRGGHGKSSAPWFPQHETPHVSSSLDVSQDLTQLQKVVNATANGSAFIDCVDVTNNTHQYGQNNVLVG
jgi:hypothetical protein